MRLFPGFISPTLIFTENQRNVIYNLLRTISAAVQVLLKGLPEPLRFGASLLTLPISNPKRVVPDSTPDPKDFESQHPIIVSGGFCDCRYLHRDERL